jgi:hypothetical protein
VLAELVVAGEPISGSIQTFASPSGGLDVDVEACVLAREEEEPKRAVAGFGAFKRSKRFAGAERGFRA